MSTIVAALCTFALMIMSASQAIAAGESTSIEPPMTFTIVRSDARCEPLCPQWIQAEGQIMRDTAFKFSSFMKKIGYKRYPILVNSGGGSIDAAMKMGRQIRKLKMDVSIGGTRYSGCKPSDKGCKLPKERQGVFSGASYSFKSYCSSACPMILAGGVNRVVGTWAFLGVHQVTTFWTKSNATYKVTYKVKNGKKKIVSKKKVGREKISKHSTTKMSPQLKLQLVGYYKAMGVNAEIVDKMIATPASTILRLNQSEMEKMGLITSLYQADLFTASIVCNLPTPAYNCVLDKNAPITIPTSVIKVAPVIQTNTPTVQDFVDDHAMWFAVVRSNAPGCEPICPQWIAAEGSINSDTVEKFEEFMLKLGINQLPIILSSDGGSIDDAIALGRAIAKHGLDIAVGSTVFGKCKPENQQCSPKNFQTPYYGVTRTTGGDTYCLGPCLAVLASGKSRLAARVTIGIKNSNELKVVDATEAVKLIGGGNYTDAKSKLGLYLRRQGVAMESLANPSLPAFSGSPYEFSMEALIKSKLITSMEQADFFSSPINCKKYPVPYNCVRQN